MENVHQTAVPEIGKKLGRSLLKLGFALLLAVGLFGCDGGSSSGSKRSKDDDDDSGNAELVKYAPENTDLILYVNGNRIAGHKLFKTFKKTPDYERFAQQYKNGFQKSFKGESFIEPEKILSAELCAFANINMIAENQWVVTAIYSGKQGTAKKLFALGTKLVEKMSEKERDNMKITTEKVDGKPTLGSKEAFVILVDKDTLQASVGEKDRVETVLKKGKNTELAKAVDTDAVVSIAWLATDAEKFAKDMPKELAEYREIATGLNIVTLSLKDAGSNLELTLTGEYADADAAKKSEELLVKFHDICKQQFAKDAKKLPASVPELVESIKITSSGKKVTVSLKYSVSKIDKLINDYYAAQQGRPERRK